MSLRRELLEAVVDAGPHGIGEAALHARFGRDYPLLIPEVLHEHLRRLRASGHITLHRTLHRRFRDGPWRCRPTGRGRRFLEETR